MDIRIYSYFKTIYYNNLCLILQSAGGADFPSELNPDAAAEKSTNAQKQTEAANPPTSQFGNSATCWKQRPQNTDVFPLFRGKKPGNAYLL